MSYGKQITLDAPFADTVARVRAALKDQGFGVLTEIDMTGTMREKQQAELEDYVILGACNPPLARHALDVDRSIGLLLPCNVVVRATDAGTLVEVLDPQVMVSLSGEADLKTVADDAGARLDRALAALTGPPAD